MNLGITVTGAILVAVCATPIVYFVASQKNNNKYLVKSLKKLAAEYGHTINQYDICAHIIIGLDITSSMLYLIKQKGNEIEQHAISLKEISATILETHYAKNNNSKVIERLGIRFLPKKGHVSDVFLEFYNTDDTFQLNGELQLVQTWIERINKVL